MRQVFTSPRLENVEAVAAMLRAEGIQVRITNDRSYRGNRRSTFTYRQQDEAPPESAVWIVNADQQPRARQLLREAGLLDSSREGASSYLPLSVLKDASADPQSKSRRRTRIKLGLLALILLVIGLMVFGNRTPSPGAARMAPATRVPPPPPADIVPQSAEELQVYRADVPTALARQVVEGALATRTPAQACLSVDGLSPSPALLQALQGGRTTLSAGPDCPSGALRIGVREYTTDGSGTGKVILQVGDDAATLDVERDGSAWRVRAES